MNQPGVIDEFEAFHRSIGWIQQAYSFFLSCLPSKNIESPKKINGIHFMDAKHIEIYENELSYSFVIRIFCVLEELCKNLGLNDTEIHDLIQQSSNLSEETKSDYKHLRNLRHVIAHGNGRGEMIRTKYVNYKNDHNGDLFIKVEELEGFTSVINAVARELNTHANARV